VRIQFWSRLALALGLAVALSVVLTRQSTTALGADAHGDFIIRCFYNADAATEDPIDDPGSFNTGHLHMFFGNLASGGAAMNGSTSVPFPNMVSGDDGSAGSMEKNGLSPTTNCQESKDTAGYWVPESFMTTPSGTAKSWLPGGGCRTTTCSTSKNLYMRVYYVPHGTAANQEIPDGTIMIAGLRERRRDRARRVQRGRPQLPERPEHYQVHVRRRHGVQPDHAGLCLAIRLHQLPRCRRHLLGRRGGPDLVPGLLERPEELPGPEQPGKRARPAHRHGSGLRGAVDPVHGLAEIPGADRAAGQ